MPSGRAAIQSCVPRTARAFSRVAATAGAAPTIAVADTARAPARKPLREGRDEDADSGVHTGLDMRGASKGRGGSDRAGPDRAVTLGFCRVHVTQKRGRAPPVRRRRAAPR
ncbi:hypothetical protein GCM10010284_64450 [Streptomyces rubiginosohelvolus]|uniref:Uncharacterized protein n=1 Tax=Streptomyces rubiginosohelvolus TaxID=67362 RepID=A0ABQ3C9R2_9ACTN|nr:hypothetical protein GCM10010284_64450 [Streptomyces rubiginosohelvolus]GGZ76839.1 hypothetical protein GCM10010328_59610 [Streptomyces pluricolorescens]